MKMESFFMYSILPILSKSYKSTSSNNLKNCSFIFLLKQYKKRMCVV